MPMILPGVQPGILPAIGPSAGLVRRRLGLDAATRALLPVLTAAGADITPARRAAIDQFFRTGRTQGWLPLVKRFYLPIWGAAAPNAIDWIALGSGTFVGGAGMHQAGYVKGNGTSECFDTASNLLVPATTEDLQQFVLIYIATTFANRVFLGSGINMANSVRLSTGGSSLLPSSNTLGVNAVSSVLVSSTGILVGRRRAGTTSIRRHTNAQGSQTLESVTAPTTGTYTNTTQAVLANYTGSTFTLFNDAGLGSAGWGSSMSDAQQDNFIVALKTLWQTCTGLTLP